MTPRRHCHRVQRPLVGWGARASAHATPTASLSMTPCNLPIQHFIFLLRCPHMSVYVQWTVWSRLAIFLFFFRIHFFYYYHYSFFFFKKNQVREGFSTAGGRRKHALFT